MLHKINHLTLKMTSGQVVEMSVNVISNSPSRDYTDLDDRTLLNYDMTHSFKPFTNNASVTKLGSKRQYCKFE